MKKLVFFLAFITLKLSAQDVEFVPDTRNSNSYYTSLKIARENINDVKTLDIQKDDADEFLFQPDHFPNLEKLDIHFSQLNSFKTIGSNSKLKHVRILYSWRLTSLPDDIVNLPNLENIAISSCSLNQLPKDFFKNPDVKEICLCNNKLTFLPEIPAKNQITQLFLSYNKFQRLPECFKNLENLEVLSLKGCFIFEFPKEILDLKKLKELDLSSTGLKSIPSEISQLTQLETLFLVKLRVKELPATLKNSSLKRVHISGDNLSDWEKENIRKALPENCVLKWTNDLSYTIGHASCSCIQFN